MPRRTLRREGHPHVLHTRVTDETKARLDHALSQHAQGGERSLSGLLREVIERGLHDLEQQRGLHDLEQQRSLHDLEQQKGY